MKTKYGLLFFGLFFMYSLLFSACTSSGRIINADEVIIDSISGNLLFKKNNGKVTGIVIKKHWDNLCRDTVQTKLIVENGIVKQTGDYYLDGRLFKEYLNDGHRINIYDRLGRLLAIFHLNRSFQDSIRYLYVSDGSLEWESLMDWEKKERTVKEYKNNLQSKETVYNENEEVIKSYDFDQNGNRIIPDIEKLELLKYQTGFYHYADYNRGQVLFQPMVLMKWKNISKEALTDDIKITGVFISGSEEWSTDDTYFQTSYGTPLQSGLTRQANVTSSVGFTNIAGIVGANIKCQIYINKQLYKTIKILNKELHSNRMH